MDTISSAIQQSVGILATLVGNHQRPTSQQQVPYQASQSTAINGNHSFSHQHHHGMFFFPPSFQVNNPRRENEIKENSNNNEEDGHYFNL